MTPGIEEGLGWRARPFGPHCRLEPVGVDGPLPSSRRLMFEVVYDGPAQETEAVGNHKHTGTE